MLTNSKIQIGLIIIAVLAILINLVILLKAYLNYKYSIKQEKLLAKQGVGSNFDPESKSDQVAH